MSSEFSLKITISTSCGLLTGDGTPSKYLIGLKQTYKSNNCLNETFNDLMPPPTGVVRGPLMLGLSGTSIFPFLYEILDPFFGTFIFLYGIK